MPTTLAPLSIAELQAIKKDAQATAAHLNQLMATLASDDEEQRAWASDCLEQIDAHAITDVSTLATHCTDPCAPLAGWACKLLGRTTDPRCEAPLVTAMLQHECITVRQYAAAALGQLSSLSTAAREALRVAADVGDARLKRLAEQALASVGPT